MDICKYYKPEWDALKRMCKILYGFEYCASGGPLHIVLDDGNVEDCFVEYSLEQCLKFPQKPESLLGMLICYEYLKMTLEEREVFDWYWNGSKLGCCGDCSRCEYLGF